VYRDLDALDAPDDSMGLPDLDGFLTGIVVALELILPSEWLPAIWGGEGLCSILKMKCGPLSARSWGATTRSSPASIQTLGDFDPIFLEGPEGDACHLSALMVRRTVCWGR
jgi:hypothetical protein